MLVDSTAKKFIVENGFFYSKNCCYCKCTLFLWAYTFYRDYSEDLFHFSAAVAAVAKTYIFYYLFTDMHFSLNNSVVCSFSLFFEKKFNPYGQANTKLNTWAGHKLGILLCAKSVRCNLFFALRPFRTHAHESGFLCKMHFLYFIGTEKKDYIQLHQGKATI